MLPRFAFAKDLSDAARSTLEAELLSHRVNRRNLLIQQGDLVGGVYLVEEGSLRVYTMNGQGRETTLYVVEPGESCILAMNCVFSDIRYPAWVESGPQGARFAVVPSQVYRQMHEIEPCVQRFTFDVLSARIFDLMSTLACVATLPMDQRLADFILRKSGNDHRLRMRHEEIASHMGTAREVVSRALRSLESAGLIQVTRGCTEVVSVEGLRAFLHP
jgi:CRP/FNR family transcriptional regulator, anaerobic regulatory protein